MKASQDLIGGMPWHESVVRSARPGITVERDTLMRLGELVGSTLPPQPAAKVTMQAAFAGYVALRAVHHPVLVVTDDRKVLFNNDAAEQLLAEGSILVINGRLMLRDKTENANLTVGMTKAQLNQTLRPAPPETGRSASLVRCGRSLRNASALMRLSIVELIDSMDTFGSAAAFVVTFFADSGIARLDPVAVGHAYDLTRAECGVAVGVAEGLTLETNAQNRRTSVLTVRSQLKSACAKIGVSRQAELTNLLASNAVFRLVKAAEKFKHSSSTRLDATR